MYSMDSIRAEVRGYIKTKNTATNYESIYSEDLQQELREKCKCYQMLVYNTQKHLMFYCILIFRHNINIFSLEQMPQNV